VELTPTFPGSEGPGDPTFPGPQNPGDPTFPGPQNPGDPTFPGPQGPHSPSFGLSGCRLYPCSDGSVAEEASGDWEACGQTLHRKTPPKSTDTAAI